LLGKDALEFVHPSLRDEVRKRIRHIQDQHTRSRPNEASYIRLDGEAVMVESTGSSVIYQGKPSVQVVFRDISDRKRAEAIARENEIQSEFIRVQREMLLAISTPLLPLREHVVLMPLVGTMDDARGQRATETLLRGIGEHGAQIAILDVTGVPAIGAEMAEGLRQTIHAAQLLGAEVVVTGIQPAIARTMIELGLDMSGIITRGTLRAGITYAFRRAR
jgi:rsbT co-antagonist protein RsbR